MNPEDRKPPSLTRTALRGTGFRSHVDVRVVKELKGTALERYAYELEAGGPISEYVRGVYDTLKFLTEQNAVAPNQTRHWRKEMNGPAQADNGGSPAGDDRSPH